jgi:hypothetical protein
LHRQFIEDNAADGRPERKIPRLVPKALTRGTAIGELAVVFKLMATVQFNGEKLKRCDAILHEWSAMRT